MINIMSAVCVNFFKELADAGLWRSQRGVCQRRVCMNSHVFAPLAVLATSCLAPARLAMIMLASAQSSHQQRFLVAYVVSAAALRLRQQGRPGGLPTIRMRICRVTLISLHGRMAPILDPCWQDRWPGCRVVRWGSSFPLTTPAASEFSPPKALASSRASKPARAW